jgi:hypothetical protein
MFSDFSGKLYPSQISVCVWGGWMVSSISQKKKMLFKFKILIKVNFKIQVTKQTTGKDIDKY